MQRKGRGCGLVGVQHTAKLTAGDESRTHPWPMTIHLFVGDEMFSYLLNVGSPEWAVFGET